MTASLDNIRRDPRTLTNLNEILSCLSAYESEESDLSSSLTELLSARDPIVLSIQRLQALIPQFDELHTEASLLSEKVDTTAKTAERVGGSVRSLDEEMRRVREASERVGQVIELKSSLASLQSSIDEKDWESAARHCSRAMSLPAQVISGPFSEIAPTAESHLPPAQTLQTAREQLLTVFLRNFEEASRSRDSAATSRFFKLFPAIGWEKEGLQAYSSFVIDLVRVQAPTSAKTSSPLYYVTALTASFESIAMIVDQHQPVVEKYYGKGKMTSVVEQLSGECDRVVKNLLEGWEEERSIQRRLSEVHSNPPVPMFSANARNKTTVDEDAVDVREIDKILNEIVAISGRWNVFKKFLVETLAEEEEQETTGEGRISTSDPQDTSRPISFRQPEKKPEQPIEPHPIENAASQRMFDDILTKYYIPLETWYTRTTMDKAHRLSNPDLSQVPPTTTTPDDVFYVLKFVLTRLLTSGSPLAVFKTVQQLVDIIDREYVGVIKRKLDDVYRTAGAGGGGGATGTAAALKAERENRQSFIILLNDLDVSSSHLDRLVKDLLSMPAILQNFLLTEQESIRASILSLLALTSKFRSNIRGGIEQLFNQLLRPKLRTFITDLYKDVSYVLDDDSYAASENQDLVRKRFMKAWDVITDGYKDTFADSNYRLFFGLVLDVLLRPWEKFVMSLKYTDLGAIRFDRDLRSVITYLSSSSTNTAFFSDSREKFTRLQQISTILNLDDEEDVDEFYNSSGITWKLTAEEAKTVAGLRV